MIILHKAERADGGGEVTGFITKIRGEYHIVLENDENTAYPVLEESITPYFPGVETGDVDNDGDTVVTQNFSDFLSEKYKNQFAFATPGKASKIATFKENEFNQELAPENSKIEHYEADGEKFVRIIY